MRCDQSGYVFVWPNLAKMNMTDSEHIYFWGFKGLGDRNGFRVSCLGWVLKVLLV